jgi:CO dehydrogenase nickel-insertion accessory protein CooC1
VILEVISLDVLSFRASSRALARLSPEVPEDRVWFVVNRASRAEIQPADVERVFGRLAKAVVPFDGAVPRLQDHGRLLAPRSRTARVITRLGGQLADADSSLRGVA